MQGNSLRALVAQREALFHLVFPDDLRGDYEYSLDHKRKDRQGVSRTLSLQPTAKTSIRQLKQIRPQPRSPIRHDGIDHFFFKPAIRAQWDEKYKPNLWDEFVRRAQAYVDSGRAGDKKRSSTRSR